MHKAGNAVGTDNTNAAGNDQQQGTVDQQQGQPPESGQHDQQTDGQQEGQANGNEQGAGASGEWFQSFPEAYHEKLKGFDSIETALEAMERGANYNPPKSVDDVNIQFPDGVDVDDKINQSFRNLCVEHGITAKAAQALSDWQLSLSAEADKAKIAAGEEVLRKEWGAKYEQNKVAALKVVSALDAKTGGRFGKAFMGSTFDLANDPAAIEALYVISEMIGEDSLGSGDSGGGGAQKVLTAEDTYKGMFNK